VTVNSGSTDRKVEYFHREITVVTNSGSLWQTATVTSGSSSTNGGFVCLGNPQSLTYDLDGNLTFDGVWSYRWDGENRLVEMSMTNVTSIPNAQRADLAFLYDGQGRRVSKTVSTWNGSAYVAQSTNKFLYDGWNLIAEMNGPNNALIRSYMWGQDLSGTMDKAGGVGGLLMLVEHGSGSTTTNHFAAYDGNGNVAGLIKTDTTLSARYEYNPFGGLIRSTGPLAKGNPLRYSTKFWDEESGLMNYGYRYYSPLLGRWISRDPTEEDSGVNLYAFILNGVPNSFDPDGKMDWLDVLRNSPRLTRTIFKGFIAARLIIPGNDPAAGTARWLANNAANTEARQTLRRSISAGAAKGTAAGIAIGFAVVWAESTYRAMDAAANVMAGGHSSGDPTQASLESMFRNTLQGDQGFADLDAIDAALSMTGGGSADSLVAWGTFAVADDVFGEMVSQ
jgi:RHS repeat-associated protein